MKNFSLWENTVISRVQKIACVNLLACVPARARLKEQYAKFYCCWCNFQRVLTFIYSNKNSQQYFDSDTTEYEVRLIIEKARRAKKELGKRSKLKQPHKTETEKQKPGTCNFNKSLLRINHCCLSIIPSSTSATSSNFWGVPVFQQV